MRSKNRQLVQQLGSFGYLTQSNGIYEHRSDDGEDLSDYVRMSEALWP